MKTGREMNRGVFFCNSRVREGFVDVRLKSAPKINYPLISSVMNLGKSAYTLHVLTEIQNPFSPQ